MGKEDPCGAGLHAVYALRPGPRRYKPKDPTRTTPITSILRSSGSWSDVRYFFYNGGNDSMDTCNKISKFMLKNGYECRVMGIPKTIDNDLAGTDHCPGFASAAKYIATSCMEVYHDARVYDTGMVTIIECMGRHAGWLTAASALASYKGCGPDLIYLPEVDFDMDQFLAKVKAIYEKEKKCIVCVSEGIHDKDGAFIAEYANKNMTKDSFGHAQLGGLAAYLASEVKKAINAKVRGIELSLLQRCAAHCASQTDIDESYAAGEAAVKNAVAGITDRMVGYERVMQDGKYTCQIKLFPLDIVANTEKKVPREWINAAGDGIEPAFIDYALPLIQGQTKLPMEDGLPRFVHLKKVKA